MDNKAVVFVVYFKISSQHSVGGIEEIKNKIEKVSSLEYTDIPKVFFTPHHEVILELTSSQIIVDS
jgi:hypothetical protein